MSHTSLTYHLVFGTYQRRKVIVQDHERELYKFIFDLSTRQGVRIRRIGGMPDHIHILCDIPAKTAVAEFVKLIKTESSKFMRVNNHFPQWCGWSKRYGAFTVDASLREKRRQYIINQRQHHSTQPFSIEYRSLLIEMGLPDDVPLLGDDND